MLQKTLHYLSSEEYSVDFIYRLKEKNKSRYIRLILISENKTFLCIKINRAIKYNF